MESTPITIIFAVIAGAGWLYKIHRDKESLLRKELRSHVDVLTDMVERVEVAANTYYQLPVSDERCFTLANTIRVECKQIGNRAFNLQINMPPNTLTKLTIKYRQAVSGGEFDKATRQAVSANSTCLLEISDAARLLIDEAERIFRQRFPR